MIGILKRNSFLIISYLILFGCILCSYSLFDEAKFNLVFNSDTMGTYYIYKDIFVDHGDIKGWYFAAAPSVFPDLSVYFSIIWLFKASVIKATFIYGLFQITAVTFLMTYIYRRTVGPDLKKYAWLIPLFFSMFYLESFYFSHDYNFAFYLTQPAYHSGAFLNALVMLAIFVSKLGNVLKYTFMFIFTVVFSFSDMLFLIIFSVPFIAALLLTFKKNKALPYLIPVLLVITGTLASTFIFKLVKDSKYFIFVQPHKLYAFDNIIPSLNQFIDQVLSYIKIPGFRSFVIVFTVLGFMGGLYVFVAKRKQLTSPLLFILCYFVVFCFVGFAAPIINGNYTGWDTLRYNVHPFYFSGLILSVVIAVMLEKYKENRVVRFVPPAFFLLFSILFAVKISAPGLSSFLDYYPGDVRQIDSVCAKHNLKRGISEYWTAKRTSLLSRRNIQVLSAFPEGNIYENGANINWFYEGQFDFVIGNSFLPEAMRKNFKIKDTVQTDKYLFLIVENFYYPRGKYFPELMQNK